VLETLVSQLRVVRRPRELHVLHLRLGIPGRQAALAVDDLLEGADAEQRGLPAEHVRVALAVEHVERPRRELHPLQADQQARPARLAEVGVERVARHHAAHLRAGLELALEVLQGVAREHGVGVDAQHVVVAVGDVLLPGQRERPDLAVAVADRLDDGHPIAEATGDLDGLVAAVVGDDDDAVRAPALLQEGVQGAGDRALLVVRRDDDDDLRRLRLRRPVLQAVQRQRRAVVQLAQALHDALAQRLLLGGRPVEHELGARLGVGGLDSARARGAGDPPAQGRRPVSRSAGTGARSCGARAAPATSAPRLGGRCLRCLVSGHADMVRAG